MWGHILTNWVSAWLRWVQEMALHGHQVAHLYQCWGCQPPQPSSLSCGALLGTCWEWQQWLGSPWASRDLWDHMDKRKSWDFAQGRDRTEAQMLLQDLLNSVC